MIRNQVKRPTSCERMTIDNAQMRTLYTGLPGDYYLRQMNAKGLRSSWFRKRQVMISKLVKRYHRGGAILDIGCGNALWNQNGMPMVGIDISERMLESNACRLPGSLFLKADITGHLPVKSGSVNTVIVAEVLEHFGSYGALTQEIHRVLRRGGVVIASVPYDTLPGLWGIVFPLWCRYREWKDHDPYYAHKCGHTSRFNTIRLRQAFRGFTVLQMRSLGMLTIFFAGKKE